MKENFPYLPKEIDRQVQEAQSPNQVGLKDTIPRHIIIKLPKVKDKERILKAGTERQRSRYKGVPIRLSADFSKETSQARRCWKEVFDFLKGKDLPSSKAIIYNRRADKVLPR